MNNVQAQHTILEPTIGKGSFGMVRLGMNNTTGELVAIKIERKKKDVQQVLRHEYQILKHVGTTVRYWEDLLNRYMVVELLGPDLYSLFKLCGKSFSLQTTLALAVQMVSLMEHYHSRGVIHRDIKLGNYLFGYNLPHKSLSLIDFGLSKKYLVKTKDGRLVHVPYRTGCPRVGTLRSMSHHVHAGIETSCRDDMYSIGYTVIYMFVGSLPWQESDLAGKSRSERYKHIGNLKKQLTNKQLAERCCCHKCLTEGRACPFKTCIENYFDYLDRLNFADKVDYRSIIHALTECMHRHDMNRSDTTPWDWDKYYMVIGT